MSKLNIIEAMKMPIGTEFKIEYTEGSIDSSKVTLNLLNGVKLFKWSSGNIVEADEIILLESRFIPIQQPVSFMEVVNSKKQCRVDFSDMNLPIEYEERVLMFKKKNYETFGGLIFDLSNKCGTDVLRKIIKEGKWYLEESEESDDERLSEQH